MVILYLGTLNIGAQEVPDVRVVGIDPGINGGISGLDTDEHTLWAIAMPTVLVEKTGKKQYNITGIAQILAQIRPDQICLERVHSMPGQGVSSTFLFGTGYGILLGIIGTLKIPLTLVVPRVWKAKYEITADKETSRAKASELFPACSAFWKLKKHDGLAEAALLANYLLGLPSLDDFSPRDISPIYSPEALHDSRAKNPRRHHNKPKGPKGHRPRDRKT